MIVTRSLIAASPREVWERITTPEGINGELMPFVKMTVPRDLRGLTIDDIEVGSRLGRSWILLFGLIPIDYDDITIAELEPGRRFLERSRMLSMRSWKHERVVTAVGEQTGVEDRVTFELRRPLAWIPGSSRIVEMIIRRIFRHRHRRLTAYFKDPSRRH